MKKGCLIAIIVLLAVVLSGVLCVLGLRWARQRTIEKWNRAAIATVSCLASDTNWISSQISTLRTQPLEDMSRSGWMTNNLLILKSGEWIVFTNACQKEDWRLQDMFIGKASDGKWYYTTYHFCIGMKVLPVMGQPEEMKFFQTNYYVRVLDESQAAVLTKTWP